MSWLNILDILVGALYEKKSNLLFVLSHLCQTLAIAPFFYPIKVLILVQFVEVESLLVKFMNRVFMGQKIGIKLGDYAEFVMEAGPPIKR
jgi:hypothetical protein